MTLDWHFQLVMLQGIFGFWGVWEPQEFYLVQLSVKQPVKQRHVSEEVREAFLPGLKHVSGEAREAFLPPLQQAQR